MNASDYIISVKFPDGTVTIMLDGEFLVAPEEAGTGVALDPERMELINDLIAVEKKHAE